MPIFTLKRLAFVGGATVMAGGAAFSYKQTLINNRKSVLATDAIRLEAELQRIQREADAPLAAFAQETEKTKEFYQTVVTLWDDRQLRYREGIRDSYSYLIALPESLGILKGISNHFRYATEQLQRFSAYDITVSKVHNFGLLLSSMESIGVAKSCTALKDLFTAEPLIHAVSCSIVAFDAASEVDAPKSVAEANHAYAFVIESFEKALVEATQRADRDEAKAKQPNLSIVGQSFTGRLEALKTVCNPKLIRAKKETEEADARERKLLRQLTSTTDVAEAARDAVAVIARTRASTDIAVLNSEEVKAALKQLDLWRAAAERFVIEAQAASALSSYQTLLAHSLAQVHDVPNES